MVDKSNFVLKSIVLACISIFVLLFFRFYSMLRPAAYGALYKEWFVGGLVLALCFLNYYILFPRFFAKRQFLVYIFATVLSTIVATFLEIILVYPQIRVFISTINDTSPQEYFILMVVLLFFRDICFILFFFLMKLLESAYSENNDVTIFLQNTNELLLARTDDKKKELVAVHLTEIAYCQQNENYAYMYLTNGTKVYRNCSLRSLYQLFTPSRVVRISRKVLVFYRHIISYDNSSVYVNVSNNDAFVGLEITNTYHQHALQLLKEHCTIVENKESENIPVIKFVEVTQNSCSIKQTEQDTSQVSALSQNEDKQLTPDVLLFIKSHPDCKGNEIKKHFHVSLSTVNRILKQLKQEGLIEYVGSKKTGGYRVRQQPSSES